MPKKQDLISKDIRNRWGRLYNLAWEYSDRFDCAQKWLQNLNEKLDMEQLSSEERTLRNNIVEFDIPQILEAVLRKRDIRFNTRDYHICSKIIDFQNAWHVQQKELYEVLIDGFSSRVLSQKDILWFVDWFDKTTNHQCKQFLFLRDALVACILSKLAETEDKQEGRSKSDSAENFRARVKIGNPPELKSSRELFIEVAMEIIKSLKEKLPQKQLQKIVNEIAGNSVEKDEEKPTELSVSSTEPVVVPHKIQSRGSRIIKYLKCVRSGRTPVWGQKAALNGSLLDLDREYPPSPFAE